MTTYSIYEAAEKLGISRKFGGRVYILDSDLEDYVKQCSTDPSNDKGYEAQLISREV